MTPTYRLTQQADADIDAIADYTLGQWGDVQMQAYLAAIDSRLSWLAEHPGIGRTRDDIQPGLRSYRQGSHLIFYRTDGAVVEIVAIPHQAADPQSYIDRLL